MQYSAHAENKQTIDLDDLKLAIQARVNTSFTPAPSREVRTQQQDGASRFGVIFFTSLFACCVQMSLFAFNLSFQRFFISPGRRCTCLVVADDEQLIDCEKLAAAAAAAKVRWRDFAATGNASRSAKLADRHRQSDADGDGFFVDDSFDNDDRRRLVDRAIVNYETTSNAN
jgi:hypothetical protein